MMGFPDADTFCRIAAPGGAGQRGVLKLHSLFEKLDPQASLEARTDALVALGAWVRDTGKLPPLPESEPGEPRQVTRLRVLVRALEELPACAERLAFVLGGVLAESSALQLFARLGLPNDRGLFGETMDRLSRRFLPEPVDERDVATFVARLLPSAKDLAWLTSTPGELLGRFVQSLGAAPGQSLSTFGPLGRDALDALRLIALRVSATGLGDALRARSPELAFEQSPFFLLPHVTETFVRASEEGRAAAEILPHLETCRRTVLNCQGVVAQVVENLDRFGVSVDVVFRLELIGKNLTRYLALLERVAPLDAPTRASEARRLLVALLDARRKDRDLGEIIRNNLHLLARKIIERAGDTGEHYITTTRGEYLKMLLSAGGGGVLTTGTAAMKFIISSAHFAPAVEGMLASLNYASSFLIMQFLGFTLATKQPSVTAAALAGSMRESAGHPDLTNLVSMIARITRSQLAAAIGNIGMVIPTAFAFDQVWQNVYGVHFLDAEKGAYVLHSLHPTESGTIFYGALTGVLLWTSSVGAGWLDNWATYRRIPEAIAEHRYRRFLGRGITGFGSRFFKKHIAGVGGNVTLGVLLGMTPIFGKFFGVPLDVRHVTLSTGAFTLALCTLGTEHLGAPEVRWAALGIAIIGGLNFGVSFVLALAVALRAREVDRRDRFKLLVSVVVTWFRSPLQFFLPPKTPLATPVHGPVIERHH